MTRKLLSISSVEPQPPTPKRIHLLGNVHNLDPNSSGPTPVWYSPLNSNNSFHPCSSLIQLFLYPFQYPHFPPCSSWSPFLLPYSSFEPYFLIHWTLVLANMPATPTRPADSQISPWREVSLIERQFCCSPEFLGLWIANNLTW